MPKGKMERRSRGTIALVSADGHRFIIEKNAAAAAASPSALRQLLILAGGNMITEVRFLDMNARRLERLCECLYDSIMK